MKTILDIETIPNPFLLDQMPEPVIDSRLKDPVKIQQAKVSGKEKQVGAMALSPITGKICAFATSGGITQRDYVRDYSTKEERRIIFKIASAIRRTITQSDGVLVTFNGLSFDIPFIFKRAAILQAKINCGTSYDTLTRRYKTAPHCDLRMILGNWDRAAKGSLAYYTKLVLGVEKEELDYSTFSSMIGQGKGPEIAENCFQHCQITRQLFKVFDGYITSPNPVSIAQGEY